MPQVNSALEAVHVQVQAAMTDSHQQFSSSPQKSNAALLNELHRLDAMMRSNLLQ